MAKTIYMVMDREYSPSSLEKAFFEREHAEAYVALAEELNEGRILTIAEEVVADSAPMILHRAQTDNRGGVHLMRILGTSEDIGAAIMTQPAGVRAGGPFYLAVGLTAVDAIMKLEELKAEQN